MRWAIVAPDGGRSWQPATLGKDYGKYSFRQWEADFTPADKGGHAPMVRCTNAADAVQPTTPNWNGSAFMRNVIESTPVNAA